MKRILILLICLLGTFEVFSQEISYGIGAGINSYRFHTDKSATDISPKFGVQANIFIKYQIDDVLGLRTEPGFVAKGSKLGSDYTHKLNYLSLPFLIEISPLKKFSIQTGPELAFRLSAKSTSNGETTDTKDTFDSNIDLGFQAGVSYNIAPHLSLNLRYFHGLQSVVTDYVVIDEFEEATQKDKITNHGFSVSLSYQIK